ncbi:acyl dehydratase [[Mycobacterium] vasticus]|uniref:Acyl dehydratase n=1 Tax=[Mycobacterium] vasticus TaxID=2875777 RepID=A0ABU5Z230_9MYCO|nr:acyl dehydratase [Mycolicibacter sp. MYC017]MEB3070279.1 acyl dehydratase [Mycolicibacter sp. MYC017]
MTQHITAVSQAAVGTELPAVAFPLSLYRLVMVAGGNRDFNAIHHNRDYARNTGAPDAYANTLFLMGMWERAIDDWTGSTGRIVAIRGFRMSRFNTVGTTAVVSGRVQAADAERGIVTFTIGTADDDGATVGPGEVDVSFAR